MLIQIGVKSLYIVRWSFFGKWRNMVTEWCRYYKIVQLLQSASSWEFYLKIGAVNEFFCL